MKRKIFVKLIGGLGNQLFQYACAKNLAIELNAELIIDDLTGFFFDRRFKRKKKLPKNLEYKRINFIELTYFYILLFIKKIFVRERYFFKIFKNILIDETNENKFIDNFFKITKNNNKVFLIGFFQSEKYFYKNKSKIISKILENTINNKEIEKIKKEISNKSICIGIRMFEEAPKNIKYNFGGIENFNFYNDAIEIFKRQIIQPNLYVFSTLKNIQLINENISSKVEIINKKFNENDDLNYLLLMSFFSNFVISNSSYYWWGAYLADFSKKTKTIASKKYININTVLDKWKLN